MEKNLEHIKEVLETLQVQSLDDSLIKDNKLYFSFNNKDYVVVMPSQKIISEAHRVMDRYKMEKVTTEKVYTKAQIKKELKEKQGIDIEELEAERLKLQLKLKEVYLDYALVNPEDKDEKLKQQLRIKQIESDHLKLFVEISEHLSPSIENQLESVYVEYIASNCAFKVLEDEKLEKIWNKKEDFDNDNTGLVSEVIKYTSYLLIKTNR